MSELSEIQQRLGGVQQDVGRLVGTVGQMVEAGRSRDEQLRLLSQRFEEADERSDERLDNIEKALREMSGPVADFNLLRRRAGYFAGAMMMVFTVVMFVFGPVLSDAVRRVIAWFAQGVKP